MRKKSPTEVIMQKKSPTKVIMQNKKSNRDNHTKLALRNIKVLTTLL
jgi:hypothetical protein